MGEGKANRIKSLNLNARQKLTSVDIESMLNKKQSISCSVSSDERDNKIIFQIFEENNSDSKIKKLDMLDVGEFNIGGSMKRIIFIGKVLIDTFNQPTFVNMFTVEVSNES